MKDLNPDQALLTNSILSTFGVPQRENFTLVEDGSPDSFQGGRHLAFNASQFAGNNPHEFLSNYAIRYQDPNAQSNASIQAFIAPPVPSTTSQFVEYAQYNFSDAFLALDNSSDDIRAIGQDFATMRNPPHALVTQRIANRGLAVEVDENEETLTGDTQTWQQEKVAYLRAILDRSRLRRTVALLVAGAVATSKTWTGNADPDMDIIDELEAQSVRSSRIIYGPAAWTKRVRTFRGQTGAGGFASAKDSVEDLAATFGVEAAMVVRSKLATGATTATNIVGSQVLMFCAADGLTRTDFSNLKTFTSPTKMGRYATYVRQVGDKRWRIAVECYELVAVTATLGLEVITVN